MYTVLRVTDISKSVGDVVEELRGYSGRDSVDLDGYEQASHQFKHWLLKYPAQCVLVAQAVLWSQEVKSALQHKNVVELKDLW
jgi:hypothetical protein